MLLDLGLDDLQIGQPLSRCSDGERQRLKLASALVQTRNQSSLICLDEPTAGLSASEVGRLLSCFDQLLNEGHSLIVIEHHPQFLARCDHLIDLGPGSGPAGGQIVISGAPEQIAACAESVTGRFLRAALSR